METFSALLAVCAGNHRSPMNSLHKCRRRRALMFSLITVWTNGWANSRDAGGLRRHCAHYDITVVCVIFPYKDFAKDIIVLLICSISFSIFESVYGWSPYGWVHVYNIFVATIAQYCNLLNIGKHNKWTPGDMHLCYSTYYFIVECKCAAVSLIIPTISNILHKMNCNVTTLLTSVVSVNWKS